MNKKDYETPVTMVIELKIESLLTISQGGDDAPSDSRSSWWGDEDDEED